jgi:hypothetical protein
MWVVYLINAVAAVARKGLVSSRMLMRLMPGDGQIEEEDDGERWRINWAGIKARWYIL